MEVALYGRVSSKDQVVETQLRELRALAERRGWTVTIEYTDVGVSGVKTERPGLNALLADAHRGRFQAVLVWKLDRLGRSLPHLLRVLDDLLSKGVEVISATEPHMDSTTPMGRLLRNILASVAEWERELIRERIVAGVRRARAQGTRSGKSIGRPRRIFHRDQVAVLRGDGLSFRQIAKHLGISHSLAIRIYREGQPQRSPQNVVKKPQANFETEGAIDKPFPAT